MPRMGAGGVVGDAQVKLEPVRTYGLDGEPGTPTGVRQVFYLAARESAHAEHPAAMGDAHRAPEGLGRGRNVAVRSPEALLAALAVAEPGALVAHLLGIGLDRLQQGAGA